MENIIPESSKTYKVLLEIAKNKKLVIFSGLPGVGKSLYIQEFQKIVHKLEVEIDVIQWDVARKSFESDEIAFHFPMGNGTVHDGVKIMSGLWLLDTLSKWLQENRNNDKILLIEAPLVGHRFVELIHPIENTELESFLSSDQSVVIMPIPSQDVREKIEEERTRQVSEDAKVWSGAKPSVMLMLWKMTCGIANEFGMDINMEEQPPYSARTYEFVFTKILKHRNFVPLIIDEVFKVPAQDETELHTESGLKASKEEANKYVMVVKKDYSDEKIKSIVNKWYLT